VKELLTAISSVGWTANEAFIERSFCCQLRDECLAMMVDNPLHQAAVGNGEGREVRDAIRNDSISWLDAGSEGEFQKIYQSQMEQLRLALNEHFFLGLFDFESHFAVYPAGGFYKAHRDQHVGATKRVVTVIFYLNEDWQAGDGGELRLWTTPGKAQGPSVLIEPRMGTLVCFMADDHWHEVLVSHKSRMSITGWFLRS
jgi:SM-20-related protein